MRSFHCGRATTLWPSKRKKNEKKNSVKLGRTRSKGGSPFDFFSVTFSSFSRCFFFSNQISMRSPSWWSLIWLIGLRLLGFYRVCTGFRASFWWNCFCIGYLLFLFTEFWRDDQFYKILFHFLRSFQGYLRFHRVLLGFTVFLFTELPSCIGFSMASIKFKSSCYQPEWFSCNFLLTRIFFIGFPAGSIEFDP